MNFIKAKDFVLIAEKLNLKTNFNVITAEKIKEYGKENIIKRKGEIKMATGDIKKVKLKINKRYQCPKCGKIIDRCYNCGKIIHLPKALCVQMNSYQTEHIHIKCQEGY